MFQFWNIIINWFELAMFRLSVSYLLLLTNAKALKSLRVLLFENFYSYSRQDSPHISILAIIVGQLDHQNPIKRQTDCTAC